MNLEILINKTAIVLDKIGPTLETVLHAMVKWSQKRVLMIETSINNDIVDEDI